MGTSPRKQPYENVLSGAAFWNCAIWRKEMHQGTVLTGLLATWLHESENMSFEKNRKGIKLTTSKIWQKMGIEPETSESKIWILTTKSIYIENHHKFAVQKTKLENLCDGESQNKRATPGLASMGWIGEKMHLWLMGKRHHGSSIHHRSYIKNFDFVVGYSCGCGDVIQIKNGYQILLLCGWCWINMGMSKELGFSEARELH